jgi:hypothetical protein
LSCKLVFYQPLKAAHSRRDSTGGRLGLGRRGVADHIESTRLGGQPLGVVDGGEGRGASTGTRFERDAVEGVDMRRVDTITRRTGAGWSRRSLRERIGTRCDRRVSDVRRVLEFHEEVVFPPVVDRCVGDMGVAKCGSHGDARAIERKCVVRESDAICCHDRDDHDTPKRKSRLDSILELPNQANQGDDKKSHGIAIK